MNPANHRFSINSNMIGNFIRMFQGHPLL
jgi:hypothetical protein